MKLISCTDFVLNQKEEIKIRTNLGYYTEALELSHLIVNYAKFLKQPLTIGMFVPCDLDGNVLEEPHREDYDMYDDTVFLLDLNEYQEAKETCIFKDNLLSLIEIKGLIIEEKTIEFLINYYYEKTGHYLETDKQLF